ncbi:MAG: Asp-tRNA(Asn)/Glu-tRNA(Gln) amidotransferase subunit GatB [Chloroflexota bacterium]|nr:Asp-tRNA(Asn)/Glu-tRNA(Gln) amidotransferase subunit GatB [Chloroflexota bacterium]
MELETIIGLEVHAQVLTQSKMYCSCSADYSSAPPNTHTCPVCLGLPGAMPVINAAAIETCIRTGLALDCSIPTFSKLDRKNYGYPDLPKGYQISQYDLPLCTGGVLAFESEGETVRAGITRVHIEEDTGRLVHAVDEAGNEISLVDLNRSGVPLMEIVGDPDLRTPEQAGDYLAALRQILRSIGASTGNMEEGAFRCDANVSVRATDGSFAGPKVEIKNMNSFRSVVRALKHEEHRQREVVANGGSLVQETRGWSEATGVTVSQRTKEQAHDYRYFPEPDLPPLTTTSASIEAVRQTIGELPLARRDRYVRDFALSVADAGQLAGDEDLAAYFQATIGEGASPARAKAASNWILNDVLGAQRAHGMASNVFPIGPDVLRELIDLVESGKITGRAAKELLPQIGSDERAEAAAARLSLLTLDDTDAVRAAAREAIAGHPAAVEDYRGGKTAAIGRLIGETIKLTGGRAKPDAVRAILIEELSQ